MARLPAGSAACAVDLISGESIFVGDADRPMKPASIQKLLTAATALAELGPEHRFSTGVFTLGRNGGAVQQLILRGGGDPTLTTESVFNLARELRRWGVTKVQRVTLDSSAFVSERGRGGSRAYLAGNSALSFNFNSIAVTACPVEGKVAALSVEPPEAGIVLEGRVSVAQRGSGVSVEELNAGKRYRVSGVISRTGGCATVYRSAAAPEKLLGAVLLQSLRSAGIAAPTVFDEGNTPAAAEFLFAARSQTLSEILGGLNRFSTNFTAEQIAYGLGRFTEAGVTRFDHQRGLVLIAAYAQRFAPVGVEITVEDASGLSHQNAVPAAVFCGVLRDAQRSVPFGAEFLASLAVSERSGTLRDREFSTGLVRGKTGTLNGVSSLAGYLWPASGAPPIAFAIIQNREATKDQMLKLEADFVRSVGQRISR